MMNLKRILTLLAVFLLMSSATAQQRGVLQYTCNIGGLSAQLVLQYEMVSSTGIVGNPTQGITGLIGTGEFNIYYQGQLTSPTANYVFVGENQFADFTDMTTNARFRVQFISQGAQLLMIANPFGPQPARYLCQAVGAQ